MTPPDNDPPPTGIDPSPTGNDPPARFRRLWDELAGIGLRPDGGYDRCTWGDADLALRSWFGRAAEARAMPAERDRNGNLWAWWGHDPGAGSPPRGVVVAAGSHLDSVPQGGAYDGPLGVVSAFLAIDELRRRHGGAPPRPLAVVAFAEEEGARFGVACLGSRLATGATAPGTARELTDAAGTTLAEAMAAAGADPEAMGPDEERLASLGAFVELHVEQGRQLAATGAAVGVASGIWPHGRWRLRFDGEANHAGTARIEERRDPMLALAAAVTAARAAARDHGGLATVGRALVTPNATNAVPSSVDAWLDARAPEDAALGAIVADVRARTEAMAKDHGVRSTMTEESRTEAVVFDAALRRRMTTVLGGAPEVATGAGHDAGILAAKVATGMLFVRNPTGVSHSPDERAADEDCEAGIAGLTAVLEDLAWR